MNSFDNLMTPTDVSRLLKQLGVPISPDTVRWHTDEGNLPFQVTVGGNRLYRRQDVERFAAGRLEKAKRHATGTKSDEEAARMLIKASHLVPCRPGDLDRSEEDLVRVLLAEAQAKMRILKANIRALEKGRR